MPRTGARPPARAAEPLPSLKTARMVASSASAAPDTTWLLVTMYPLSGSTTTPEPVAPALVSWTSMDTTTGVTRPAMSATDPGSRLTPGETEDSWVPGASSGSSSALWPRNQAVVPPMTPTNNRASRASTLSRTETSRRRSFRRPRASTTIGPSSPDSSSGYSAGAPRPAGEYGSRHGSAVASGFQNGAAAVRRAGGRPPGGSPRPVAPSRGAKARSTASGGGGGSGRGGGVGRSALKEPATSRGRPNAAGWAGCGSGAGGVRGWTRPPIGAKAPLVPAGRAK